MSLSFCFSLFSLCPIKYLAAVAKCLQPAAPSSIKARGVLMMHTNRKSMRFGALLPDTFPASVILYADSLQLLRQRDNFLLHPLSAVPQSGRPQNAPV